MEIPNGPRSAVAPSYLLCCLVLGGSAQGIWQNMVLQLLGVAIIAWAAASSSGDPLPAPARFLLLLAIAGIAVVVLQAVPLPSYIWEHGVRAHLMEGYRLLGREVPPLPISLSPYESLGTLLCFIPPLAIFCAIVRLKAFRPSWLAASLLIGATGGIVFSALQVARGGGGGWYPYPETNVGVGVGFFANANHMADLLVIAIPFLAALAAAGRTRNFQRYAALLTLLGSLVLVLIAGIALTHSLAGYLLAVPAIAASALIVLPQASRWRGGIAIIVGLTALASLGALTMTAIGSNKLGPKAAGSVESRAVILHTTTEAISDNMPFGTGLGSFVRVYRLYETPETVTSEYVVHAHNEYAELALELGLSGIILMLLFLAWWARAAWAVWLNAEGGPFTRAAAVAAAIVLLHSLVDFPLRTAAISACFAMCLALLADRRRPPRQHPSDLRPSRHLVFS